MRAQFINNSLNEASFFNFNSDSILTNSFIKHIINELGEEFINWYMKHYDIEDADPYTIMDTPEYLDYIKNELETNLEVVLEDIYDKFDDNGNICIYRQIITDENWLHHLKAQGKRLGIYWSWEKCAIASHWGDLSKKNETILEAQINEKYVDWKTTLELNSHPYYNEEKEIRLFKNTPIKLISIIVNGQEIDISYLSNKKFYA